MKVMVLAIAKKPLAEMKPPTEEALLAMHNYNQELEKAGVLLDLGGLMPTTVRVRTTGGKRTVIDGPFPEAKEMVAGYCLLEVKSLAEAVEWVKRAPGGSEDWDTEIRPLFDPSAFDVPGEAEQRAAKQGK